MRLSELLGSTVIDASGAPVGTAHDCRMAATDDGFEVTAIVVNSGRLARLAHAGGFVAGHAQGPWLLRAVASRATRRALFVSADEVRVWSPGRLELHSRLDELRPAVEVLRP